MVVPAHFSFSVRNTRVFHKIGGAFIHGRVLWKRHVLSSQWKEMTPCVPHEGFVNFASRGNCPVCFFLTRGLIWEWGDFFVFLQKTVYLVSAPWSLHQHQPTGHTWRVISKRPRLPLLITPSVDTALNPWLQTMSQLNFFLKSWFKKQLWCADVQMRLLNVLG